ncbi:MAG: hypothetical protein HYR96_16130 [Deltaproteobacteria bacterium]|nr:hypothetical protein [Deltaproteobacteria bacterium]MBI3293203.1 hypothetical protein [Deltaproteobacteria bacterium]
MTTHLLLGLLLLSVPNASASLNPCSGDIETYCFDVENQRDCLAEHRKMVSVECSDQITAFYNQHPEEPLPAVLGAATEGPLIEHRPSTYDSLFAPLYPEVERDLALRANEALRQ